jgi:hypothetical protein
MKNLLLFTMLFIVLACNQNTKEDETPAPCCSPPTSFHLFISKSAPEYQDFLNNKGEGDRDNVYFYQIVNNTEKKYHTLLLTDNSKNKDYAEVATERAIFLYTGKTETLYLKNKAKTYKIEFLGTIGECCSAHFQEMYIDGVKNNDFILIK